MTAPDPLAIAEAIAGTWPPAARAESGPFSVPEGAGGGNRVSAARLRAIASDGSSVDAADITKAAERQAAAGQSPLFVTFGWQRHLDNALEAEGYRPRDATDMLACPVEAIAEAPPPVTCFDIWPPLAVQEDIWRAGGIGAARLDVMGRAQGPKTTILGRTADRPAGTAFVALHDDIAMLHALEIAAPARRRGLARTMMRFAALWASEHGASHFATLVTRNNKSAQALYASLGLTPVGHYLYRAK